MSVVVFIKSLVAGYTRRDGTVVKPHSDRRTKRQQAAPGQLPLFDDDKKLPPNRFKGADPVAATPDMFDTVTEPRAELIAEHKRLVNVLNSPSHKDDKVEAKKQAEELKEYEGGKIETPDISAEDAKLLEGLPTGSHFRPGKGIASNQWGAFDSSNQIIGNLMATKLDAANSARSFLRNHEAGLKQVAETDANYVRIAEKLRAGKELTDSDLKQMGLNVGRASRFDYLSPVVQKLFGISRMKVREAMGDALSENFNDMGTKSWWADPRKALANAAKYADGTLTKSIIFLKARP